jgi:hypothetical protein
MKEFLYFENRATLLFRGIISSGVSLDKMKLGMSSFIKYVDKEFKEHLETFNVALDFNSIQLDTIIDAKYKFLLKGVELKNCVSFLQDFENRQKDFKGKDENLRALLGFYFLYYMVVVRIVETYLGALTTYNVTDPNNVKYTLKDIGIDMSVLKFFANFEDLRVKTIDDWLALNITPAEDRYFVLALKRIFAILGNN